MPPLLLLDDAGVHTYDNYDGSNPLNSIKRGAFTFHDGFARLTGGDDTVSLRLNNVSTPSNAKDAANKTYVDDLVKQTIDGLQIKQPVAAATINDVAVSDLAVGFVVDGYTLAEGDRVLLKDQTNAVENGIWLITATSRVRPDDFQSGFRATGSYAFVDEGLAHKDKSFVCVTDRVDGSGSANDIVDTHPLQFNTYSVRPGALAGDGLEVDETHANRMRVDHDTVPYLQLTNTFTEANTFESVLVVNDHIEAPYVSVTTENIITGATHVINREYHEAAFNEFRWKQPVDVATEVNHAVVANDPTQPFILFASTGASNSVYRPRNGSDNEVATDGPVQRWGGDSDGTYGLQFEVARGSPTYNSANGTVDLNQGYMPVNTPSAVTLKDQTIMICVEMSAAPYENNKVVVGYGGPATDRAQVVTMSNEQWRIAYTSADGTISKNIDIAPGQVLAQIHTFALGFTYRSVSDDFLVQWQYMKPDGTVLAQQQAQIVQNNAGSVTGWPLTANPGGYPFGLGHYDEPTSISASIKDVRVFPSPLQPIAMTDAFNSMVAVVTSSVPVANLLTAGITVDGRVLSPGDRVLLLNQSNPVENGIYEVDMDRQAPVRSVDASDGGDLSGAVVVVGDGADNSSKVYVCSAPPPAIVGSSNLAFSLVGQSPGQMAGNGLIATQAGTLRVNVDDVTMEITDANTVQVKGGLANAILGNKANTFIEQNTFTMGAASTSKDTGSIVVSNGGGIGIDGSINCDAAVVHASTPSGNMSTGALQVVGGVGVQGDLHCNAAVIHNGLAALDKESGALQVEGGIGVVGDVHCEETVVHSTRASVDKSTGSVRVAGGIGVQGDIHCEASVVHSLLASQDQDTGSLRVLGGVGVKGDLHCENSTVHSTTQSTSALTGAFCVSGGVGIQGNSHLGSGTISTDMNTGALVVDGGVGINAGLHCNDAVVHALTPSNSMLTGAFQVAGGVGVQGDVHCRAAVVHSNSAALDKTTGALQILGGVGVVGDVHCDKTVVHSLVPSTSTSTGSLRVSGGVGVGGDVHCNAAEVHSLAASTTPSTGAFRVAGGLGVGGAINCQEGVTIHATTESTSRSTGALRVTGGVGIQGNAHVGSGTASNSATTGALVVNGGAGFSGAVHCSGLFNYSDVNLKTDLVPLEDALDAVSKLSGYSFTWKSSGKSDVGVVAQEVEAMDPRCVSQGDFMSVDYTRLVPYLLQAVKQVNDKADGLKRELESLQQTTARKRQKV